MKCVFTWRHCAGSIVRGSNRAGSIHWGGDTAWSIYRGGHIGAVMAAEVVRVQLGVRHPGEVAQQLIDWPGAGEESENMESVWQLDNSINYKLCYVTRSLTSDINYGKYCHRTHL